MLFSVAILDPFSSLPIFFTHSLTPFPFVFLIPPLKILFFSFALL